MRERFEGQRGRQLLVETLAEQKLVAGNLALAEEIASVGELTEVLKEAAIIAQGADDNDVYFVVAGSFVVLVNGKPIARRSVNDHVGEMSAIQPSQRRSATLLAEEVSVVVKVTEEQFSRLGSLYPEIYRGVAKELARRLMQRNALVTTAREKVHIFIISSAEALEIARTVQACFERDPFDVVVWTDGVFRASHYAVESLEKEVDQSDFAIAIAQPDDVTVSRGTAASTARDNVVFELGFCMGRLGRHRSILMEPRGEEPQLPSDLSGITTISYKYDRKNLAAAVGPACHRIRQIIEDLGPIN
jgi:predicted nucleotide-binding protein